MKAKTAFLIAAAAFLTLAGSALAQNDTAPGPGPSLGAGSAEVLRPGPLPDEIQALIAEFRENRREILQLRVQLMEKLRNCTAEERAALVAEYRQKYREQIRAQMELRKQIRRELMELRRERRRAAAGG